MIYRTFFGAHIDLSKILSINEPVFEGSQDYYGSHNAVGFTILFQLQNEPLRYFRSLKEDEYYRDKDKGGFIVTIKDKGEIIPLALFRMRQSVNELIQIWRIFIEEEKKKSEKI